MRIRLATHDDLQTVAWLVSQSHRDVAERFGLNAANCPTHPSCCTPSWIQSDLRRGALYFMLELDAQPIGCVAYESPSPGLAYLNRLSVLPAYRRQGCGALLVQHLLRHARAASIQSVSLGAIDAHGDLQRWYRRLGFTDGEIESFAQLPFAVKYMRYAMPSH